MNKRGNGEGSIKQRAGGRWEARISLENGGRKSLYGTTRAQVASKLAAALRDRDRGLPILGDERQTVGQFLTQWLADVKAQLRPSSHRRYSDYVRVHLVPTLGKVSLAKLTPQHLQALYSRKLADGLSPTTVHGTHRMLHRALVDAERLGLVQRNVSEHVRPPRPNTKEMQTLTEEQAAAFLAVARQHQERFSVLYVLALQTGMRQGELLGLRWTDVDLERRTLTVRMAAQEAGHGYILAEPKTRGSRRTIGLTVGASADLRAHRVRQAAERLAIGPAWGNHDLVFPNQIGGLMNPRNLARRSFLQVLWRAGLPVTLHFHCLRHTAATTLLSRGVNVKVVSEMLGHADISITLRIYAHVLPHMQQSAVDVMQQVYGS